MIKMIAPVLIALSFGLAQSAVAGEEYNDVPAGNEQYKNCKIYAMKKWEGGEKKSRIAGQSKAEAFCTCLWNETPENFKGGLATFSESEKGAKINDICEKYSGWTE
jgi:hypothetical protein